ncbi:MAG TPA: hypothetical protein VEI02_04275, partial [Planctomycetota bacterium]|nr:hypothetical protein [Planctomycetota bacterium]
SVRRRNEGLARSVLRRRAFAAGLASIVLLGLLAVLSTSCGARRYCETAAGRPEPASPSLPFAREEFQGRVVGADGVPIPEVRCAVGVIAPDGTPLVVGDARTGEDGRFVVELRPNEAAARRAAALGYELVFRLPDEGPPVVLRRDQPGMLGDVAVRAVGWVRIEATDDEGDVEPVDVARVFPTPETPMEVGDCVRPSRFAVAAGGARFRIGSRVHGAVEVESGPGGGWFSPRVVRVRLPRAATLHVRGQADAPCRVRLESHESLTCDVHDLRREFPSWRLAPGGVATFKGVRPGVAFRVVSDFMSTCADTWWDNPASAYRPFPVAPVGLQAAVLAPGEIREMDAPRPGRGAHVELTVRTFDGETLDKGGVDVHVGGVRRPVRVESGVATFDAPPGRATAVIRYAGLDVVRHFDVAAPRTTAALVLPSFRKIPISYPPDMRDGERRPSVSTRVLGAEGPPAELEPAVPRRPDRLEAPPFITVPAGATAEVEIRYAGSVHRWTVGPDLEALEIPSSPVGTMEIVFPPTPAKCSWRVTARAVTGDGGDDDDFDQFADGAPFRKIIELSPGAYVFEVRRLVFFDALDPPSWTRSIVVNAGRREVLELAPAFTPAPLRNACVERSR